MKSFAKNSSGILRLLLVTCMVAIVACGADDDGDTTVIVNPDPERQEEQGPVESGPTVIINNNVATNVRVTNRRTRIENNDYVLNWQCRNVDPVVHKQYIHISVNCPTVVEHDRNRDGYLDQVEVQQALGPAVLALDSDIQSQEEDTFPSGSSFEYNQRIPLQDLRRRVPAGQDFVVMYYGVSPTRPIPASVEATTSGPINLNIPIACKVFKAPEIVSDSDEDETTTGTTGTNGSTGTTTTTGGTNGGETTGDNGTTAAGTDGGATTGDTTDGATTTTTTTTGGTGQ